VYYAATSLITFVVQMSSSRFMLERFGLALTTSTPSAALFAGGIFGLIAPGFGSVAVARGAESVFRGSLFRAGYELFYTPIPAVEKRAAKAIIDVAFDRLGDAVGGGMVRATLLLAPAAQYSAILSLAMACSAAAMLAASRLNRGYIDTLEKSLLNRAVELDLSDLEDSTSRTLMLRTLGVTRSDFGLRVPDVPEPHARADAHVAVVDPEIEAILALRSRDPDRVVRVLRSEEGLSAALVPHVIPLLAWHPVAADAVFALRKVAEERIGLLIDALIDPNQDFTIRRRLARVFSVCVSQRAADGLMLGLDDQRFEVRFQCGHSLASLLEKNPRVTIDAERIFAVVMREAAVGRPVWESRRLLDELDVKDEVSFVDEFVRDRAGQSLAHVFTLLSTVLPREPLLISFRSLYTDDQNLQGTALEYLEGVLPTPIRDRLWPFLEDRRPVARSARARDEILADLLRSNHSIMLNLEELRRRAGVGVPGRGES
jgi:ATP:ADP antiporter, AAA family